MRSAVEQKKNGNEKRKRNYVCPVPKCGKDFGQGRKKLKKHLVDELIHDATELLACGVEVWYHRENSAKAADETYLWLKSNRFIRDQKRKREEKYEEKADKKA